MLCNPYTQQVAIRVSSGGGGGGGAGEASPLTPQKLNSSLLLPKHFDKVMILCMKCIRTCDFLKKKEDCMKHVYCAS